MLSRYRRRRTRKIDRVLEIALEQIGKPYVEGSDGPSAFDCSGLVRYAYLGGAGVDLPHNSFLQFKRTLRVFRRGLRPRRGDLVFYYHPVDHVALYLGNRQIVQAGNPELGISKVHLDEYARPVAWGRVQGL